MKPPIPNSYWVEPGRMLAGEHPHGGSERETRERVAALLAAGIRGFIDLTQPDELPPYQAWLPDGVAYAAFPMPDHSVPQSVGQMRAVQDTLGKLMQSHGAVYVHCRAGIGRTGMTVGCYLRERGETPSGAMAELNRLWQQNARAANWPSIPETIEQERYVTGWGCGLQRASLERIRGCLIGMAVGDIAATAPGRGTTGWSDDTGTTICAIESLLACGGFDGRDQLERLRLWAQDPAAQGAGSEAALRPVARQALARAQWNRAQLAGSHDPARQDGSPLARCAAAALYATGNAALAVGLGADLVRITHQAAVTVDSGRLLAAMLTAALQGQAREEVLARAPTLALPLREEVAAVAAGWSASRPGRRPPVPGMLGALDRAARAFARSTDFVSGLERALTAPSAERDAVAATYGALAGAWYGASAIPAAVWQRVAGMDRLETLAGQIFQHADAAGGPLP